MIALENMEKHSFYFGKTAIEYSILPAKRKTLEIAVHPDNRVIVRAPINSDLLAIEAKLKKRARWIIRQLKYFSQFQPRTPERKYVNGETHLYLGRQYRLKITSELEDSVKLSKGYFLVSCRKNITPEHAKILLDKWYSCKAIMQFKDSIDRSWPKLTALELNKPNLAVRHMQRRWGSLSEKGTLTLNPELVKTPRECIDYVVIHELCHLKYHDHSPAFYKLLESIIPEWEKIKHKLELSLF